jgi:hypothetical protein
MEMRPRSRRVPLASPLVRPEKAAATRAAASRKC